MVNILPPLLYTGSVKNVRGEVSESFCYFEYSDRYSIFDWGEMPDHIDQKGVALNRMGAAYFEYLEKPSTWVDFLQADELKIFDSNLLNNLKKTEVYKKLCSDGLNHHFLAVIDTATGLENNEAVSQLSKVKKVNVIRPEYKNKTYDYQKYLAKPLNCLVPLEVIFRTGLVIGNSFTKRLKSNPLIAKDVKQDVNELKEGEFLKKPFIDFSTKLEKGDRYLSYSEAQKIAGLSDHEFQELQALALLIGLGLFVFHKKMNTDLWDGKIELAFSAQLNKHNERDFILVDSIGIDELRLTHKSKSLSKEFLRENYKKTSWYEALEKAKDLSKKTGQDFKIICQNELKQNPAKLANNIKEQTEFLYKAYCNSVLMQMDRQTVFEKKFNLDQYLKGYL